jgi:hypothetical protein
MTTTPWNVAELKAHDLQVNRGRGLTPTLLSSLSRLNEIFRYHLWLARDAANGIFNTEEPGGVDNMLLVLGQSEKHDELEKAKIVSEANMIGCIHAARGQLDIFAQLVNELVLNPKLAVQEVDFKKVLRAMPAGRLQAKLQKTRNSDSFKYVDAFVNTTKHRQLVPHMVHVSFVGDSTGLRLDGFAFANQQFASYSIKEALQVALDVSNEVVLAGSLLNDYVIRRTP